MRVLKFGKFFEKKSEIDEQSIPNTQSEMVDYVRSYSTDLVVIDNDQVNVEPNESKIKEIWTAVKNNPYKSSLFMLALVILFGFTLSYIYNLFGKTDSVINAVSEIENKDLSGLTDIEQDTFKLSGDNYYTVKKGDTLYRISKKTGVPVDAIKIENNLEDNIIREGDVLKIPIIKNDDRELNKADLGFGDKKDDGGESEKSDLERIMKGLDTLTVRRVNVPPTKRQFRD